MSTLDQRGVLDLQTTEDNPVHPLPSVALEAGDGNTYMVSLIPMDWQGSTRLLFLFGKASGSVAKIAYVLDQNPRYINIDTFCKLIQAGNQRVELRDCWIGWLAMHALFGGAVTLGEIDPWELRQFDSLSRAGTAAYLTGKLTPGWTEQLEPLRAYLALEATPG